MSGQDLVFSQYFNAPLRLNPAFAGIGVGPQFNINYRLQWPGISQTFESYALGYNQYFNKIKSGIGVSATSDSAGDGTIKHQSLGLTYMYKMRLVNDWELRIGLELGYTQSILDWDKLVFYDQIDPISGPAPGGMVIPSLEQRPENLNNGYLDVGTGLLVYNTKWYAGLSMQHLNSPVNDFLNDQNRGVDSNGIPILFNIHGGYQFILESGNNRTKPTFLSPSILFAKQADYNQLNIGTHLHLRNLIMGVMFRHTFNNSDALIFSVGASVDNIKINYSFDFTTSALGFTTKGSHELGILITLGALGKEESKLNNCFLLFR